MVTNSFLLPTEFELDVTFLMAMLVPHQRGDMSRKAKTCKRGVVTIQRNRSTASWHAIGRNKHDVSVALRTTGRLSSQRSTRRYRRALHLPPRSTPRDDHKGFLMHRRLQLLTALLAGSALLATAALAQQYVYPAKGQSADQQKKDEYECHQWAVKQTGFDPTKAPPPAAAAPPPETGASRGSGARGAARGAVVGEIVADDASTGRP